MGSRRRWYAALAATFVAACSVGAPTGFSEGATWTIPLIGPLEDGLLLVPALVNGKGPFVFAIDPDAHVSIIDQYVLKESGARTGEGPRLLDENDTQQNRFYAEILEWQLGTLTVKGPKPAQLVMMNVFDADGRRIHGVIGRDIIADTLVFGFDRDAGVAVLTTLKAFKSPANATTLGFSVLRSQVANAQVLPISRRLVNATINGQRFTLHLDFGATPSQLRARSWAKAKLVESDLKLALVDEVGMPRNVKKQGTAESVSLGTLSAKHVTFVPYEDKRWPDQDLDGTIALGFLKPYNVSINWDQSKVYITKRGDPMATLKARIGRWQSKTLTSCANAGCVKLSLIDPLAGKPPDQMPAAHPGLVASIVREPAAKQLELEVLIAVTPAAGKPPLKWLVANLPMGAERAMTHLPADYVGATLTVVDAGFFPRKCPAEGGCVDLVAPPLELKIAPTPAPAAPPPASPPEPPSADTQK